MSIEQTKESYYLTTPIYYVNGVPHLGTAYTTVASDSLARFMRLNGKDVYLLTGLDEHGQKVAQAAEAEGKTPQQWVDEVAPQFKTAWAELDIIYDDFIRTTEQRHIRGVQQFFEVLYNRGYIYKDKYQGYYCVPEETFFTDEQLEESAEKAAAEGRPAQTDDGLPFCPDCGRPLSFVEEENLFFKLSAFEQSLLDYYTANPDFIQPKTRKNEVVSFVQNGLKDLSVSRTTFDWGVPIPFAPGHVSYVWVDALINYITAVGYGDLSPQGQAMFARRWPAQIHFIGKDIIRFHCVIWPAMLMAAGLEPPQKVFAHGFLLTKGEKMSKSRGNAMSPSDLARIFSVDAYRYYFLSDVQFGADGAISLERMLQVYNADLANSWGNLCSRALNMTAQFLGATTPELWEKTVARLNREMGNPLRELVEGPCSAGSPTVTISANAADVNAPADAPADTPAGAPTVAGADADTPAGAPAVADADAAATDRPTQEQEADESLYARYARAFAAIDYSAAMAAVMELVHAANLYIDQSAPWTLAKEAESEAAQAAEQGIDLDAATAPTTGDRLAFVLYNILESIRICALLLAPVMPNSSAEVWRRLGLGDVFAVQDQAAAAIWGGLSAGLDTTVGTPLFMRRTLEELEIK
ncbi:MAG: methionine--tRNA ligase [Coriobacteriales bacterium]|jgi:methionyl-tRNA synthetase|nr:methionine--tRNA ligase [Coriobacteriales bacterium]